MSGPPETTVPGYAYPSSDEKVTPAGDMEKGAPLVGTSSEEYVEGRDVIHEANPLQRNLHGRHMQMIAIGGSIGAGLFIGSGGALSKGGPASLTLGFIIIGFMMLCVVQALGEMAVLYPVNGAFFRYMMRFIDPAWGCAVGWDYAIGWLTVLPFELTAAGITIRFWREDLDIGIWIATFFVALCIIQVFGVRGYGEVEYVLGMIKILACVGFILFGIIDVCGGVPTDDRGYIGARYWHDPGAFRNGFKGFSSVFVTAAFAFGGTELAGLAAAEASDPGKQLPRATKQVFWRVFLFYVLNTFIVGLLVPSDNENLLNASGANSKYSPFVIAFKLAGVKGMPSVFNVVITIAVLSVANSCTYGSTRTFQALAQQGMAPKALAYVDKQGRPLSTVALQLVFALLAFINEAPGVGEQFFNWLLALSGVQNFFVWGSICLSHIRFRQAWARAGHSVDELPFQAIMGIWGSYIGLTLNVLCLCAQFYVSAFPIGEAEKTPGERAEGFFGNFLAAPFIMLLYLIWKIYTVMSKDSRINHRGWKMYLKLEEIDVDTGIRDGILKTKEEVEAKRLERANRTTKDKLLAIPLGFYEGLLKP